MSSESAEFERLILSSALKSPMFARRAMRVLRDEHFSSTHRAWIWNLVKECIQNGDQGLDRALFIEEARAKFDDAEEVASVVIEHAAITSLEAQSPNTMLQKVADLTYAIDCTRAIDKAAELRAAGRVEEAIDIALAIKQRRSLDDGVAVVRWAEEGRARQDQRRHEYENPHLCPRFKTGLPSLNRLFHGGIQAGLGAVQAVTNRGKSIMMCNFGWWAMLDDWSTLFIPTEMHASRIAARFDSLTTKLPYDRIVQYGLNSYEQAAMDSMIVQFEEKYKNRLRIASVRLGCASLDMIQEQFDLLLPELSGWQDGTHRVVVLLDTPQQFMPPDRRVEKRMQQAAIGEWCKDQCEKLGLPFIVSLQLSKGAANREAQAEDVSESYDWARLLDWGVAIDKRNEKDVATPKHEVPETEEEEDPAEAEAGLQLAVTKARDSGKNLRIDLDTDLSRMMICEKALTTSEQNAHRPVQRAA